MRTIIRTSIRARPAAPVHHAATTSSSSSVLTGAPTPQKKGKVHVLVGADGTRRYAFERGIPFADVIHHTYHHPFSIPSGQPCVSNRLISCHPSTNYRHMNH
jgi:hypothetical protein